MVQQKKTMKQGRKFIVFPDVIHAESVDHVNIKGMWSHFGDMPTLFLCSVVFHLY